MKIATTRSTGAGKLSKSNSSGKSGSSFSIGAPLESSASESSVELVSQIGAIDSLILIQGQRGNQETELVKRGNNLLDRLEDLRIGMLTGEITVAQLNDLASYAKQAREASCDPNIETTIQEIEQRVQVELAKRGLIYS